MPRHISVWLLITTLQQTLCVALTFPFSFFVHHFLHLHSVLMRLEPQTCHCSVARTTVKLNTLCCNLHYCLQLSLHPSYYHHINIGMALVGIINLSTVLQKKYYNYNFCFIFYYIMIISLCIILYFYFFECSLLTQQKTAEVDHSTIISGRPNRNLLLQQFKIAFAVYWLYHWTYKNVQHCFLSTIVEYTLASFIWRLYVLYVHFIFFFPFTIIFHVQFRQFFHQRWDIFNSPEWQLQPLTSEMESVNTQQSSANICGF